MARLLLASACCVLLFGCFGPEGVNGDGSAGGAGGTGGTGGGSGTECDEPSDCRLVDERCCGCGPAGIDDPIRAVPFASSDFGAVCDVPCPACPSLSAVPVTVVADCVEGRCEPVVLQDQPYAQCTADADCVARPVACCGWCGNATVENSYALNASADFQPCPDDIGCPDIACPPPEHPIEAFCSEQGACSVRAPEVEETCAGLGCGSCDAAVQRGLMCGSGACSSAADCVTPAGSCTSGMGFFTTDFRAQGCVDGRCLFEVVSGGCPEFSSCQECAEQAVAQTCGTKPLADCAACCLAQRADASGLAACACTPGLCGEPCAGTTFCGGTTDPDTACASCLREGMRGGACVDDPTFQSDCIQAALFCPLHAQCLASCPAQ